MPSPSRRLVVAVVAALAALSTLVHDTPAPAAAPFPSTAHTAPNPSTRTTPYVVPVDRPVIDPFRLPMGRYGAGNRGLEYGTCAGDRLVAIGDGRVAFAGPVAGTLAMAIVLADGRRVTYTRLTAVLVAVGRTVQRGEPVALAAERFHLGLLEAGVYIDPAPLLGRSGGRVRLRPGSWWFRSMTAGS